MRNIDSSVESADITFFSAIRKHTMTLHLTPAELTARHKAQQKAWREQYPDKIRAYHRKYAAKEDVKERKKNFEKENRERINTRRRELYRLRNPFPSQALEEEKQNESTGPEARSLTQPTKEDDDKRTDACTAPKQAI